MLRQFTTQSSGRPSLPLLRRSSTQPGVLSRGMARACDYYYWLSTVRACSRHAAALATPSGRLRSWWWHPGRNPVVSKYQKRAGHRHLPLPPGPSAASSGCQAVVARQGGGVWVSPRVEHSLSGGSVGRRRRCQHAGGRLLLGAACWAGRGGGQWWSWVTRRRSSGPTGRIRPSEGGWAARQASWAWAWRNTVLCELQCSEGAAACPELRG